jgi:bacillolysin
VNPRRFCVLVAVVVAFSVQAADFDEVKVVRQQRRAGVSPAGQTAPRRPDASQLRAALLRVAPPIHEPVARRAAASRPSAIATSFRENGTPRQLRPVATDKQSHAAFGAIETARAFLNDNRALLRLEDPDRELVAISRVTDNLGKTHVRFQQQFLGIDIWPAELIVHLDERGQVELVDGAFVPTPRNVPRVPTVSAATAIRRARGAFAPAMTSVPELIIIARGARRPRLAWKMKVHESLTRQWITIVDAMNGSVLMRYNDVKTAGVSGSGRDASGATRSINVWQEGATFYLLDASKAMFNPQSLAPFPSTTLGGIFVTDAANLPPTPDPQSIPSPLRVVSSTSATTWNLPDSVSASFWMSKTYDYFLDNHGRNSIDGEKGTILGVVRLGNRMENAFWLDEQQLMAFGDGDSYVASLDVIAHEMAHGVTSHTANLVYQGQSGALNEAFSDIFGEMAEFDFYGSNDWEMGSQISAPIRSMKDPSRYGDPARMSQFLVTGSDNGGVHTNSGIINRAFYMLAEGLSGAIGRRDAERIFYRTLTQHLTKDSQFIDARLAAIASAQELFGAGSTQAVKTAEAFDAVEIFAAGGTPDDPAIPVVQGSDSTLFLYRESTGWFLGRREGSDPLQGVELTTNLHPARPAVTRNGQFGVFVTDERDACLIATNGTEEVCLNLPASGLRVSSVGMSPDGRYFGFVLFGTDGDPEDDIIVVDIAIDEATRYTVSTPSYDGAAFSNVRYADTMTFTADNQFLVFDALNEVDTDGEPWAAWSIYALDLESGQVFSIVPAIEGLDIGYPSLGSTSDDLLAFEAYDSADDVTAVFAADLDTGDLAIVGETAGLLPASPSYTGDDRAIVWAASAQQTTGASLARTPLAADHITPSGQPQLWLGNAAFGAIYRRGTYSGPTTQPGTIGFTSTTYNVNEGATATVTLIRSGGNKGALSINYTTANGTATSSDYTPASGTITWADGEDGIKMFNVRALTDTATESAETVGLSLNNGSNATLTITNQAAPAAPKKRRSTKH